MLCVAIFFSISVVAPNFRPANAWNVTFRGPASASDLNNFYRSIQALSADSLIDSTAVAIA
jgi:hypothetical protein